MTVSFTRLAEFAIPYLYDGSFGFNDGTYDYITGGWTSASISFKKFFRSADNGVTWVQQSDFAYEFHTAATAVVNGVAYIVGGDVFAPTQQGDWRRDSYKFQNGAWTQIASNCGIENRCIAGMAYHLGSFYLIGGQYDITKASAYNTVMKSTDSCASFASIVADTRTLGFKGGLLWGGIVSYNNLLWKICGGVYMEESAEWKREADTAIWTSPDGITWTHVADFKGIGRHYHQCIVYNDKIWIFGGYHGNGSYLNLNEVWTIEQLSSGRIIQTYEGTADYGARHAMAIWEGANGLLMFGGSNNSTAQQDCWLITEV